MYACLEEISLFLQKESLSSDLVSCTKRCEEFEIEVRKLEDELKTQGNLKIYMEQTLEDKLQRLEMELREVSALN